MFNDNRSSSGRYSPLQHSTSLTLHLMLMSLTGDTEHCGCAVATATAKGAPSQRGTSVERQHLKGMFALAHNYFTTSHNYTTRSTTTMTKQNPIPPSLIILMPFLPQAETLQLGEIAPQSGPRLSISSTHHALTWNHGQRQKNITKNFLKYSEVCACEATMCPKDVYVRPRSAVMVMR